MTVQETFDNFILSRQLADLSPKTVSDYRQFIMPFVRSVGPEKPLEDVTQQDLSLIHI